MKRHNNNNNNKSSLFYYNIRYNTVEIINTQIHNGRGSAKLLLRLTQDRVGKEERTRMMEGKV